MRILLASCLLFSGIAFAAADAVGNSEYDVPQDVRYAPASAEVTAEAERRLRTALTGGPDAFASLLGLEDEGFRVTLGPFFGIEIDADNLQGRNVLGRGKYRIANFVGSSEAIVDSFGAIKAGQKRLMAHYLFLAADLSNATIRRPTFDELALVWYWIGWDLEGPLFVAESATEKYFFDFDGQSGRISWIERLTLPCITGKQGEREVMSCHCAEVERKSNRARVAFKELKNCRAPAATAPMPVTANSTSPAATPISLPPIVHLHLSERTGRVDMMLARAFAGQYTLFLVEENDPSYRSPGKLLEGSPPQGLLDAHGKHEPAYVLLGLVIGADGRVQASRVLLSTDERASASALEAVKGLRVEPPTRGGVPVAEMIWNELVF